jgi:hypothetical protein
MAPGGSKSCIDLVQFWATATPSRAALDSVLVGNHPQLLLSMTFDETLPPNAANTPVVASVPESMYLQRSVVASSQKGPSHHLHMRVACPAQKSVVFSLVFDAPSSQVTGVYITTIPKLGTLRVPGGQTIEQGPYSLPWNAKLEYTPDDWDVKEGYDRLAYFYTTSAAQSTEAVVHFDTVFVNSPPQFITPKSRNVLVSSARPATFTTLSVLDTDMRLGDQLTFTIHSSDPIVTIAAMDIREGKTLQHVHQANLTIPSSLIDVHGHVATAAFSVSLPALSLQSNSYELSPALISKFKLPQGSRGYRFSITCTVSDAHGASEDSEARYTWVGNGPLGDRHRVGVAGYAMLLDSQSALYFSQLPDSIFDAGFALELWINLNSTSMADVMYMGDITLGLKVRALTYLSRLL